MQTTSEGSFARYIARIDGQYVKKKTADENLNCVALGKTVLSICIMSCTKKLNYK